ncbi:MULTISPECIES: hypothetical protein [unclassified Holdemanella]|uniref:hypothetical protein n=1 Tax=unclassified Holdemanella TaxID=2633909 RepID=UPI001D09F823|nr:MULTISPECIES: hypothetical protein [unclassified Holdemanella]MCB8640018.1 hypothetical protein [Holdemanella sp. DFI.5.55]MCG5648839.1 hypothetical protein [Holdemanella sp. DFI.5.21]
MVNWEIVHDCDDENENSTCWVKEVNSERYGKYIWITLWADNKYHVEYKDGRDLVEITICKTLTSAKRWVSMYIGG